MKKRLLITSIVMMLVVAVALSTATYAWFSSNAKVEASSMTLKASTSSSTALGIGWTDYGASTEIDSEVYGVLQPMAPKTLGVGTTTAESLLFYTGTTKTVDGIVKFNETPAVDANVEPVIYNNGSNVQKFYVKNMSNANEIASAYVTAVFKDYYVLATGTFTEGVDYYSKNGDNYTKLTAGQGYTLNDDVSGEYVYAPYVESKDTSVVSGVTYYTKSGDKYTVVENPTGNPSDKHYYEEIGAADDMIRVALFTRKWVNQAGTTFDGSKAYYAYTKDASGADVLTAVDAGDKKAADLATYYLADSANHTLIGVLAKSATVPTEVGTRAYDKNEIYYELDEGVYKVATITNWTEQKDDLFTCEYTAVYGDIEANKAVNTMGYYTNVKNAINITEDQDALQPGEQIEIIAYVWLDGTLLDDSRASEIGTVSLEFTVGSVA